MHTICLHHIMFGMLNSIDYSEAISSKGVIIYNLTFFLAPLVFPSF